MDKSILEKTSWKSLYAYLRAELPKLFGFGTGLGKGEGKVPCTQRVSSHVPLHLHKQRAHIVQMKHTCTRCSCEWKCT